MLRNSANRAGGGIEDASGPTTTVTISGSVIMNNNGGANPGNGGGIHIGSDGDLMVMSSEVDDNVAVEGGGIWNSAGTLTLDNTGVSNNIATGDDADQGGGGLYNNGNGTIILRNDTDVTDNQATGTSGSGGGILNNTGGTLTITDSDVLRNSANRAGGGIEDASGGLSSFTITGSNIADNTVATNPGNGGGIHIGGDGNLDISGSTVENNTAGAEGGGIWNGSGSLVIDDCVVRRNIASGDAADEGGGGLFNVSGMVSIEGNSRINRNQATGASGSGGGLLSLDGTVMVDNSQFRFNTANRAGGAVEIVDGMLTSTNVEYRTNSTGAAPGNGGAIHVTGMNETTVSITGGSIRENEAANQGGGVWNQSGSEMFLTQVRVLDNLVQSLDPAINTLGGAGVYNNGGTMSIDQSTIARNSITGGVTNLGGGVFNNAGEVGIARSTISGNSAADGGGIYNREGTMGLGAVTVALNQAGNGGGYAQEGESAQVTVTGSAFSDNEAFFFDPDFLAPRGVVISEGYNLISDDGRFPFPAQSTDIIGQSANFGPLSNNGGTTLTHVPQCPSPVIDAGDPNETALDQIGQSVFGGTRDIGAFEKQSACTNDAQIGRAIADFDLSADRAAMVQAFPNPASGDFMNVVMPNTLQGSNSVLRVIDGNGRVQYERQVESTNVRLDVAALPSGVYSLEITSDTADGQTIRFVIMH